MLHARMRSRSADRSGLIRRLAPLCLLTTIDALAKWNVALKLGREPGTSMPETWAANGARFFLQTQVEFGDIHEQNLEQLKKLNLAIFPVRYNQKFYKNMLNTPKEFTQVC